MKNHDLCKFVNGLFDLENKVAVVIGGTGVLCGAMAWGLLMHKTDTLWGSVVFHSAGDVYGAIAIGF